MEYNIVAITVLLTELQCNKMKLLKQFLTTAYSENKWNYKYLIMMAKAHNVFSGLAYFLLTNTVYIIILRC